MHLTRNQNYISSPTGSSGRKSESQDRCYWPLFDTGLSKEWHWRGLQVLSSATRKFCGLNMLRFSESG